MATNDNRCWPGYEPVPGKRKNEQGSCRKKAASRSTPSEQKFRAERREQLEDWKKEHPDSRRTAAQHLGKPRAKKRRATKKATSKKTAAAKKPTTQKRVGKKTGAVAKK